ncbi:Acyltransferase 3 [Venturia nashicola]|uniref:Acyltransferase 3 n=1 Tax=Venturia nashicola TaxID=86259 RepID=A0A4Z1P8I0_9PEZI|nr:Acyltransferase 3 [Venturia nashicola]TLD32495.1 Acyltransferase 3 [Venturia nashicola]
MSRPNFTATSPRDTKWAEGLRGIACIFVVTSHLALGYAEWLTQPVRKQYGTPAFYNGPFIRIFAEGRPWVSMFLLLTGFVNALKPIKLARAGRVDTALESLASSCFRRTSRLVLPCTVATVFVWILCELGGFRIGHMVDAWWMEDTSPLPSKSVSAALRSLIKAIFDNWKGENHLEKNQWVVHIILEDSLKLYVALLALVRATPGHRMLCFGALFAYSWINDDNLSGIPICGGAILAELSMDSTIIKFSASRKIINRVLPFLLFILGLYMYSFPSKRSKWTGWSQTLNEIGTMIFPHGSELWASWASTGSLFLLAAVILSEPLQRFLSHPAFLYLGTHSFPIYLIHGPLLRSFLNWMLYLFVAPVWHQAKEVDHKGHTITKKWAKYKVPPAWKFIVTLPIFFTVLLWLAQLWTAKIEPQCGRLTKWLEDTVCGNEPETPAYQTTLNEFTQRKSSESSQSSVLTLNDDILPR